MNIIVDANRALRDMSKMAIVNDGTRTLLESTMVAEVNEALRDWLRSNTSAVLIGGLAISHYGKPRVTQDVDMLFLSEDAIPAEVPGFKRIRAHAFRHSATHVEVEVLTPEHLKVPQSVVAKVFETATTSDGARIASPSGLIALKLFAMRAQDRADIVNLLLQHEDIDLTGFGLPQEQVAKFIALQAEAEADRRIAPLGE